VKPLIRWTIGPTTKEGCDALELSIKCWKKVYKNFDLIVCYNLWNERLKKLDVELISQEQFSNYNLIKPKGNSWKLYPPRLRPNSHEIFIDNDLVLYKKVDIIDEFLESFDLFFITCGLMTHHNPFSTACINSGLFGIPPHFDLQKEIDEAIIRVNLKDWEFFDEQGLVGSIITKNKHKIIPIDEISNCYFECIPGKSGSHFCGVNSGHVSYWNQFQTHNLLT
jgi:hypothetical protein